MWPGEITNAASLIDAVALESTLTIAGTLQRIRY